MDDDIPCLSADTLKALNEFYQEQIINEEKTEITEDWKLSQFWYDNKTAETLAKEAIRLVGENGRIACISCPTVYRKLHVLNTGTVNLRILEYDKRFSMFGDNFIFYNYREPLSIDKSLENAFDVVIADPPYLSKECLINTAETIKFLSKDKIILCTGAVMENVAFELLGVRPCKLVIQHQNYLGNEFKCYVNYSNCFPGS